MPSAVLGWMSYGCFTSRGLSYSGAAVLYRAFNVPLTE